MMGLISRPGAPNLESGCSKDFGSLNVLGPRESRVLAEEIFLQFINNYKAIPMQNPKMTSELSGDRTVQYVGVIVKESYCPNSLTVVRLSDNLTVVQVDEISGRELHDNAVMEGAAKYWRPKVPQLIYYKYN